jgi:hypothetical protein
MNEYPESERYAAVADEISLLHEFLQFLQSNTVEVGRHMKQGPVEETGDRVVDAALRSVTVLAGPAFVNLTEAEVERLILAFFKLDPKKLEVERRAIIKEARS